jgi:hypothetical protein
MLSELISGSITPLDIAEVFTSPVFPCDDASALAISCYSDVSGSLAVLQSNDEANFDVLDTIAYIAAAKGLIEVNITARFAQVIYTNGAVAQATFRLFVAKKKGSAGGSVDLTPVLTILGSPVRSVDLMLGDRWDGAGDLGTDIAAIIAAMGGTVTTGTFSLLNNTDEQDVIVVAAATQAVDIELDMSNLTQVNTVREYTKVDGANYRQIAAKTFPTDFDSGTKAVLLSFTQKDSLYKVTLKASVAEGSAKDVPWRQMVRRPI